MLKTMFNEVPLIGDEYDKKQWKSIATHSAVQISGFFGEYLFLSNFWQAWVIYDGRVYQTVENAYQAAKFSKEKSSFFENCSPEDAKRYANDNEHHIIWPKERWDVVKVSVMRELLYVKFSAHHPDLRDRLKATGTAELKETNWWGDKFWGAHTLKRTDIAVGENNLGKLLMEVRGRL